MINGCILPCVASLLWFVLNQPRIMGVRHLPWRAANVLMLLCVGVTFFLSSNVMIEQTLGRIWPAWKTPQMLRAAAALTALELCLLSAFIWQSRTGSISRADAGTSAASIGMVLDTPDEVSSGTCSARPMIRALEMSIISR